MTTKLTNWKREQIARDVLQHRFSEAVEKLVADRAAFAEKVYNDIYSKATREKMAALPVGWLPEDGDIGVQFGEQSSYASLRFSGAFYGGAAAAREKAIEPVNRRVLSKHKRGCVKVYEKDHRLSTEYEALSARESELNNQYREANTKLNSALNSASTAGRLVALWPEIQPFVERHAIAPNALPAIPTDQLNALLDLPVAEAA